MKYYNHLCDETDNIIEKLEDVHESLSKLRSKLPKNLLDMDNDIIDKLDIVCDMVNDFQEEIVKRRFL